jgi:low affinity Fe/Cu permease
MIKMSPPAAGLDYDNHAVEPSSFRSAFRKFSSCVAAAVGSPWAFVVACVTVVVWAVLGPHYRYSDTWQLVINTGTTIVTFLMVFLIQNTQNRDAKATHLKLDELIRAVKGARNHLVDLEDMSDQELDALQKEFQRLRKRATAAGGGAVNGARPLASTPSDRGRHDERGDAD